MVSKLWLEVPERISFRVSADARQILQAAQDATGLTPTEMINGAIARHGPEMVREMMAEQARARQRHAALLGISSPNRSDL